MVEDNRGRLILIGEDGVPTELTGAGDEGVALLDGIKRILTVGRSSRLLNVAPFDLTSHPAPKEPKKPLSPPKYYPEIPLGDGWKDKDMKRQSALLFLWE